ncbi:MULTISPECIES: MurR/RpiR family transcriptional regulator [unclassified Arsukibacterium]|uniref:MurR/RpiR family transcriptional regulator n=1 Tax=unclassified Arsukibacterium TaxID=2635278 RepID=UPI000C5FBAC4|nr:MULTISPECIES: MurR/RpiR family transcriptional regulator [unclassified Arsukibacterium]MAA94334.1 RpiR family transcriptional regulator [Rheinheimera sp.]MBM34921.1 RpiR family transcriptional regulator [Rheinheimera sp.]HAW94564.1 MurR/RpiR family transcriptional regulator [Candidatus Azambacteria bacterium]|tara:strand:+ start:54692 stop:55537 length:846 start_codon:yes stop_codon:yes gene_type:complete
MLSLLKIRGMLDQMSVIERKLAEFILDNAHMLRDYSSQQLADAVGISQSSVVKFCQKLGYKGYPDLKLAINEAVVTASTMNRDQADKNNEDGSLLGIGEQLQFSLQQHLRTLLTINDEKTLLQAARLLQSADKILLAGFAKSAIVVADMQFRLLQLGKLALHHADPALALQLARSLTDTSVLLLVSDSGQNSDLLKLEHYAKSRQLKIISLTSYKTNAQSLAADITLFTLSAEEDIRLNPLLTQLAQQHLCHMLYLQLCHWQNNDLALTESTELLGLLEKP